MRDVMSWRGRHPGGMGDGSRWSVGGKGGTTTGTSVEKRVAPRQGEWRLHKLILPYKTPQKPNVSRTRWPYVSAIPPAGVPDQEPFGRTAVLASLRDALALREWSGGRSSPLPPNDHRLPSGNPPGCGESCGCRSNGGSVLSFASFAVLA